MGTAPSGERSYADRIFDTLDINQDGKLDRMELIHLVPPGSDVSVILAKLDTDGDGLVDRGELCRSFQGWTEERLKELYTELIHRKQQHAAASTPGNLYPNLDALADGGQQQPAAQPSVENLDAIADDALKFLSDSINELHRQLVRKVSRDVLAYYSLSQCATYAEPLVDSMAQYMDTALLHRVMLDQLQAEGVTPMTPEVRREHMKGLFTRMAFNYGRVELARTLQKLADYLPNPALKQVATVADTFIRTEFAEADLPLIQQIIQKSNGTTADLQAVATLLMPKIVHYMAGANASALLGSCVSSFLGAFAPSAPPR